MRMSFQYATCSTSKTKLPLDSVEESNTLPALDPTVFRSHRSSFGPSPVPELKRQRPDLFADSTKNDFCANIYHHLLQRSLIDFLARVYRASWKTEPLLVNLGSIGFGRYGGVPSGGIDASQTVLRTPDLDNILDGNFFSRIHIWPSQQLCLPPGSKMAVRVPPSEPGTNGKGEIRIANRFCTITITTETVMPTRTIGEYRVMAGLTEAQAYDLATNLYLLRAHVRYTRWLSGHPQMKTYEEWATQMVTQIKNQFDEQLIWALVKEDDLAATPASSRIASRRSAAS